MTTSSGIRVLVVEDDVYLQKILHKRLVTEGYEVECAADGRDGMKRIVSFDPLLVISDWMMPHVDGLELCQSVKTGLREEAPYFILLTAKSEISDKLLALETGADDYLIKPCEPAEILARVKAGLRQVLVARELRQALARLEEARGQLETSRAEAKALADLLLCPFCKRVRESEGAWEELDRYLDERGLVRFGAGICNECHHEHAHEPSDDDARAA